MLLLWNRHVGNFCPIVEKRQRQLNILTISSVFLCHVFEIIFGVGAKSMQDVYAPEKFFIDPLFFLETLNTER